MKLREILQRLFFKLSYLKNEKIKQFFISVLILLLISFIVLVMILFKQNSENRIKKNILEAISKTQDEQNMISTDLGDKETLSGDGINLSASSDTMSQSRNLLIVYICGEVKKPGVYEVENGARINDLILIAGGASKDACLELINPAQKLIDGQKVYIPSIEEKKDYIFSVNEGEGNGYEDSSIKIININLASKKELETLPGIGSELAARIIKYRELNGGFKNIEELKKVSGIGEKKFNDIKTMITI